MVVVGAVVFGQDEPLTLPSSSQTVLDPARDRSIRRSPPTLTHLQ
ncbi:hypothetical protein [Oxynema sp. CENA135]|nr:hypothetical protein [Oxynema sp. CENA135]